MVIEIRSLALIFSIYISLNECSYNYSLMKKNGNYKIQNSGTFHTFSKLAVMNVTHCLLFYNTKYNQMHSMALKLAFNAAEFTLDVSL